MLAAPLESPLPSKLPAQAVAGATAISATAGALSGSGRADILVSMTSSRKPPIPSSKTSKASGKARVTKPRSGFWVLQDAKARFSELVRKVRSEGPQHVTVHGRDEVVVVSAEEFRRLQGRPTGQALIAAMQASPYREIDLEPTREAMPVRDVSL
jgi:prevent-host-death family protein